MLNHIKMSKKSMKVAGRHLPLVSNKGESFIIFQLDDLKQIEPEIRGNQLLHFRRRTGCEDVNGQGGWQRKQR